MTNFELLKMLVEARHIEVIDMDAYSDVPSLTGRPYKKFLIHELPLKPGYLFDLHEISMFGNDIHRYSMYRELKMW